MERFCIRFEALAPGVIIVYTLRPDQRPRHPEKEWRGKVLCYDRKFYRAMVESLEVGYEGCEDEVWLEQITRIEWNLFRQSLRVSIVTQLHYSICSEYL